MGYCLSSRVIEAGTKNSVSLGNKMGYCLPSRVIEAGSHAEYPQNVNTAGLKTVCIATVSQTQACGLINCVLTWY